MSEQTVLDPSQEATYSQETRGVVSSNETQPPNSIQLDNARAAVRMATHVSEQLRNPGDDALDAGAAEAHGVEATSQAESPVISKEYIDQGIERAQQYANVPNEFEKMFIIDPSLSIEAQRLVLAQAISKMLERLRSDEQDLRWSLRED